MIQVVCDPHVSETHNTDPHPPFFLPSGNNYGRWTGDGITHMYAVDAIVCPDGLRCVSHKLNP